MAYFLRVLGKDPQCVPLYVLREALACSRLPFELRILQGPGDKAWDSIELGARGRTIAVITRLSLATPDWEARELTELFGEFGTMRPFSAASWLAEYLAGVRVVYRLEVLPGIDEISGWPALHLVEGAIWEWAGGILQSDGEGFTNENGYFVLWHFREDASGPGNMAVLEDGDWIEFEMDLGDVEQRAAFLEGRVPEGAAEGALSAP